MREEVRQTEKRELRERTVDRETDGLYAADTVKVVSGGHTPTRHLQLSKCRPRTSVGANVRNGRFVF